MVSSPAELNSLWTTPLWLPLQDLSPAEEKIAARAAKKKKLFVFLRNIHTIIILAEILPEHGAE